MHSNCIMHDHSCWIWQSCFHRFGLGMKLQLVPKRLKHPQFWENQNV